MKEIDKGVDVSSMFTMHKFYETDSEKIARLELEKQELISELGVERVMRKDAENKVIELEKQIEELISIPKRKRRTKKELEDEEPKEYTEYKSNGVRKARKADSIRSYDDFVAIQNYYLERGKVRDWAMWTVGVSLGLRISDIVRLKFKYILNNDKTFRNRIMVYEKKTSKLNNCLITESVKDAMIKYLDSINWKFEMDNYVFISRKSNGGKEMMEEETGWRILSSAGKSLNLPFVLSSHSMRRSFANIAACVDKSVVDMNSITKIQGLLNHSDQRTTMRYLGTYQNMYDKAREAVSDFVLGKTDVNELVVGTGFSIDDVMQKIDHLEEKLTGEQKNENYKL